MAKFLKKYLLGDNEEKPLPSTRKGQILSIIKEYYASLILMSVFTFVFALPVFIVLYIMSYNLQLIDTNDYNQIFYTMFYLSLILIVANIILYIGLSGLFSAIRKMVYNEYSTIMDYFMGIKENAKRFALIGLIYGVSLFLLIIDLIYYENISSLQPMINNIVVGIGIIQYFIISIMSMYMMCQQCRYNLSFKDLVINSFKFTMKNILLNFAIYCLCFALLSFPLLFSGAIQALLFSMLALFAYSISALLAYEYCAYIFDLYVNKTMFPIIYLKGLKGYSYYKKNETISE